MLIDRDCHKSHHYACVLSGAQPVYLDAFPPPSIRCTAACQAELSRRRHSNSKAEGRLDRVKAPLLTNATFDGHMANVARTMEECLAIKPDLVFPGTRRGPRLHASPRCCAGARQCQVLLICEPTGTTRSIGSATKNSQRGEFRSTSTTRLHSMHGRSRTDERKRLQARVHNLLNSPPHLPDFPAFAILFATSHAGPRVRAICARRSTWPTIRRTANTSTSWATNSIVA
ncbi:MAG: hypothetical protein ACOYD0_11305 [Candidatus Nanopelagicales bacterium]